MMDKFTFTPVFQKTDTSKASLEKSILRTEKGQSEHDGETTLYGIQTKKNTLGWLQNWLKNIVRKQTGFNTYSSRLPPTPHINNEI